ncbi:MAG: hypothetical protein R2864_06340 [Syntrophotaleaceae bacterium]
MADAILTESALSFLGIGVQPPDPFLQKQYAYRRQADPGSACGCRPSQG